jgi:hypothetical protein
VAFQTKSVPIAAAHSATFTFTKPIAGYVKSGSLTVTPVGGDAGGAEVNFLADVDNGDGTMTGTARLSDDITGTVEVCIADAS